LNDGSRENIMFAGTLTTHKTKRANYKKTEATEDLMSQGQRHENKRSSVIPCSIKKLMEVQLKVST